METSDKQSSSTSVKEVQNKNTNKPKQKWSVKKKIAVIAGAVVVFIVAVVAIALMATSGPTKAGNEFVDAIQAQDSTTAYDMMSAAAQNVTNAKDFETAINKIGPILDGTPKFISSSVNAEAGSDTTAKVVYEIDGNDGITYRLTINLVKNEDKWEVQSFISKAIN